MPSPIMLYSEIKAIVEDAWAEKRVVPLTPPRRRPGSPAQGESVPSPPRRDRSSSWSAYIRYENARGEESERRITCQKVARAVGGLDLMVTAFCHEAGALRQFRVDRIAELVDLETGELVDPQPHFEKLRLEGLPFSDAGLEALAKILVFVVRCDGCEDWREWDAVERAMTSYALRYGSSETDMDETLAAVRPLAPDSRDFCRALGQVLRAPSEVKRGVADLVGRACADVIDADGRHMQAELHWGEAIDRCLRVIRD